MEPTLPTAFENIFAQFEAAWEQQAEPELAAFLPPADSPHRIPVLIELVRIDLERRQRLAGAVTILDYFAVFPELSAASEKVQHGIAEQLKACCLPPTSPGAEDTKGVADAANQVNDGVPTILTTHSTFRHLRFHARGGLGEVLIGEDDTLGRKVALKIIQTRHSQSNDALVHFHREAEITSRLEHPGVVPVHSIGKAADGRPCYTMRFIEGQTLHQAIRQFHAATPAFTSIAFHQLLRHFLDVCNTMAYAHSRGVIHRDLKPANIMLGSFGETWLLDWGLARQIELSESERSAAWEPVVPETGRDPSRQMTLGSGTPGYMAPEQIDGPEHRVGNATDIYSLGIVLQELLTGQRPVQARDVQECLNRTRRGDLPRPRLLNEAIPVALEAICLKARALLPTDRYASVVDLANDVERWLADEPVSVHREPTLARMNRWRRKHPRAVSVLATAALLGIAGLIIGFIVMGEKNQQLSAANIRLNSAHAQLTETNADLTVARDDARRRYKLALDAFNQMVFGILNKLEDHPGTQDLRKDLLENARAGLKKLLQEAEKQGNPDSTLVWSYFRMGDLEKALGHPLAAQQEYQDGHDLARDLADADRKNTQAQHDLSVSYNLLGSLKRELGQSRDALDYYQKSLEIAQRLAEDDPKNAQTQRHLGITYNQMGDVTLEQLGQAKASRDFYQKGLQIAQRLAEADPRKDQTQRDLSISYENMGNATRRLGQTKEAVEHYQKGFQIRQRLAGTNPRNTEAQRDLSVSCNLLGNVYLDLGQTKDALDFYEQMLQISKRLAEADPNNVRAQRDLGLSYRKLASVTLRLGRTKDALDFCQKSLQIDKQRAEDEPKHAEAQRSLSISYAKMGEILRRVGNTKDALDFYQKSLQIDQKLAEADPKSAEAQRDLSISYNQVGQLSLQLGMRKEALEHYQKSLQIAQRLAETDPRNAQAQRDLSVSYNNLGDITLKLEKIPDALRYIQKSLEITQRLAEADPKNTEAQRDLGVINTRLGDLKVQSGQKKDAFEFYRKSLEISQRLAKADPMNAQVQRDVLLDYNRLGYATHQLGQFQEAREFYQQGLQFAQRLAENDPKNAQAQRDIYLSCNWLANVTLRVGQNQEALDLYQKALQIAQRLAEANPKNARARRDLAVSYELLGAAHQRLMDFAEGAKWYQKMLAVVREWPDPKELNLNLRPVEDGLALCQNADQAIAAIDFIFTQNPDQVPGLLGIRVRALLRRRQLADATASAKRFASWAEQQEKDRDAQRYNAACSFALCAAASDKPDTLVDEVIELLTRAKAGGYFTPQRIDHLRQNADFDGIRQHPGFVRSTAELDKQ